MTETLDGVTVMFGPPGGVVGVGVAVAVGVCVGVAVGVEVAVGVRLAVGVGVDVAVDVAVAVGVGVGVPCEVDTIMPQSRSSTNPPATSGTAWSLLPSALMIRI